MERAVTGYIIDITERVAATDMNIDERITAIRQVRTILCEREYTDTCDIQGMARRATAGNDQHWCLQRRTYFGDR